MGRREKGWKDVRMSEVSMADPVTFVEGGMLISEFCAAAATPGIAMEESGGSRTRILMRCLLFTTNVLKHRSGMWFEKGLRSERFATKRVEGMVGVDVLVIWRET